MNPKNHYTRRGFTLVELLVVIAIVAVLASIAFLVSRKMMSNAKLAESIGNLRGIGTLVATYTADNSGRLPALREFNGFETEQPPNWHWNQLVASVQFPEVSKRSIADDKDWWSREKPVARNPQMPESLFQTYYSGYAMNLIISENHYQKSNARDWEMILRHQTPLAALQSPERTPLIVPHWNWHTGDMLRGATLQDIEKSRHFLNGGKMNVAFVDGHVEAIAFTTPDGEPLAVSEYASRGLHQMPKF